MIEKINWFFIKNNVYLQGYDYKYYYVIDHLYIIRAFQRSTKILDHSVFYKLSKKEIKEIKEIKKKCLIFNDVLSAIKYFNRQKIINNLLND